jgi:hypothetical protein
MAMNVKVRSDRLITERQRKEKIQEHLICSNLEQIKHEQKALWENRTADVIRSNKIEEKIGTIKGMKDQKLAERRKKLAEMLADEQRAYEHEMVEKEETPQQRMEKMAVRAYELKKRREDERQSVVQEKLYQQWRESIDELRQADSKLFELHTLASRDRQVAEKAMRGDIEAREDAVFQALWQEGYHAKVEREEREKELKKERCDQAKKTLETQLYLKQVKEQDARDIEQLEREEMKRHWAAQEQEEAEQQVRDKILAREERKTMDEFAKVQKQMKEDEEHLAKEQDRQFVLSVLAREKALAEQEELEKQKARQKTIEFTEALKLEMARKAESEERLIQMQHEEAERQWQKRYAQWEKEEIARRKLMNEVYTDRADQVRVKEQVRDHIKNEVMEDRKRVDDEVGRLEEIEKERSKTEALVRQRHQEELFREMDYHQVQRHRQLQQHAIEQRQAMIAEEKYQRAMDAEKGKAVEITKEIMNMREKSKHQTLAPWEK